MEKRQVAVMLAYREPSMDPDPDAHRIFKEAVFDEDKVYKVFNEVLSNPIYEQNMKKLQKI